MPFVFNQNRDASATIAGFVYQIYTTVLRWLDLNDGEELELEAGEDIDTVRRDLEAGTYWESRTLEQIKRRQAPVTLRSPSSLEALSNFNIHRLANPDIELRFRYVTTALATVEKGWPLDRGGVATWQAIRAGELSDTDLPVALENIRQILLTAPKPGNVQEEGWAKFQTAVASKECLLELIVRFEWSVANDDYPIVEQQIKMALVQSGLTSSAEDAQDCFDRLVLFVLRKLCSPGHKALTLTTLRGEIHRVISDSDRKLLTALQTSLAELNVRMDQVEQRVSTLEQSVEFKTIIGTLAARENFTALVNLSTKRIVLDVPDIVQPSIPRSSAVAVICEALAANGYAHLAGEPGSGKTQLALLAAKSVEYEILYIDIPRDVNSQTACGIIDASLESATGVAGGPALRPWYEAAGALLRNRFVIIDNLPRMTPRDLVARRLELLADVLRRHDAKLISISYYPLTKGTLDKSHAVEFAAPRFTEEEIVELLVLFGASDRVASGLKTLVHTATQGLPVLVVAVARFLSAGEWVFDMEKFESILKAEFAQDERSDARGLVRLTVPDDDTRELLYRLTLVIGGISKWDAENVAKIGRRIPLPLEKLDRLIGLWLQPFIGETFLLSPLIDPGFSSLLDEQTRRATHAILGASIMARGEIYPLDVFACFHHFAMAGLFNQAAIVLFQTLMALVDVDPKKTIEGTDLLTGLWLNEIPAEVGYDLRVPLRALQIVTLDNRGRNIDAMLAGFDEEIQIDQGAGWGKALATSFLAMRFYKKYPQRANGYILLFLRSHQTARLADGKQMPGVGTSLEELLWATAQTAASEADVVSWINTVEQLDEAEIVRLQQSTLATDNATILCDGIWLRDYRKNPGERDWDKVEAQVTKLRNLGRRRKISILEAAAIRTLIMLKAEWQNDIDGAVSLAETSVTEFARDEDAFLIVEVTGRQLFYNARSSEAEQWLDRARSYPIKEHALWRRNVQITLAEIRGKASPGDALGLVREAVEVSRKELEPERLAEAYAEEVIANWNLGDKEGAFQSLSLAIHTLLSIDTGSITWKQCFAGLFQMAFYYSSRACDLKVSTEVSEPTQGAFLGLDNFNISAVNASQRVIIQARMSMFAEGIGATDEAGQWFDRALSLLEEIPEAKAIRMHAGLGIAPALLAGDVVKAIRLGLMMADAEIKSALALEHVQQLPDTEKQAVLEITARGATIQAPFALFRFMTPIAAQLATAKLNGAPPDHLQQTTDQVFQALKDRPERQHIFSALQTAILEGKDWDSLHQVASTLVPQTNTLAAGMIYMIGAALHGPISASFGLQVWLARHVEKLFVDLPSIQSKIFYPFLESYWKKAVDAQAHSFRTAQAYTRKAILDARSGDNPRLWARILLRRMTFCLYGSTPEQVAGWLNSDDLDYPIQ